MTPRNRLAPAMAALSAAVVAAFAGISLWFGVPVAQADASMLPSRWLLNHWRNGTGPMPTTELWQQAVQAQEDTLHSSPGNAQTLDDLGFLYAARAMSLGAPRPGSPVHQQQQALLTQAIQHYQLATSARPTFPYTWAHLALAMHHSGNATAAMWTAYDNAVRYGRAEPGVQMAVARVALAHWTSLSQPRKAQFSDMVATARPKPRQDLISLAEQQGVSSDQFALK